MTGFCINLFHVFIVSSYIIWLGTQTPGPNVLRINYGVVGFMMLFHIYLATMKYYAGETC